MISSKQISLPKGVNDRLRFLLDCQDKGLKLTRAEKLEADGLVELAELLTLWRLERNRAEPADSLLEESAVLYAEIYAADEELQELTESALLEPVYD